MNESRSGYWQASQDQTYDSGDNTDPQSYAGTWVVSQLVDDSSLFPVDDGFDLEMLFGTQSDQYGCTPAPDVDPHPVPTQQMLPSFLNESYDVQQHVFPGPLPVSSHQLRPEAVVFEPVTLYQGQYSAPALQRYHTVNADLVEFTHPSSPRSTYGTPIILDSESAEITDERLACHMLAMERAANKHFRQRRRSNASSHRSDQSHHVQSRIEKPARASSSQARTLPTRNIRPANFHGWDPGYLAPSEDIASWSNGTYAPTGAVSQFPADTLVPPPSNGPSSRHGTASIADSNGSFYCSSEGCQKSFVRKSALDHHERNHRAGQHLCLMCGKAFIFYKDLKRHMKIHCPERHFFCTYIACLYHTKGFQRKDHLKRHMQNVHGEAKQKT